MTNLAQPAVLDLAILADMYGDDSSETMCQVLTGFRSEAAIYIDQLQQAAIQQDFSEIARLSHSLKSMCGLIGASQLLILCNKAEQAARQHDQEILSTVWPELEQLWAALLAALTNSLQPHAQYDA